MRYQIFVNGKETFHSNSSEDIRVAFNEIKRFSKFAPCFIQVFDNAELLMQLNFERSF